MPVLIALAGIAIAALVWYQRARIARDMVGDLSNVATEVRLAARRFGFRRKTNIHPAESIEDTRLAVATIATAFIELDDLPTQEQRQRLTIQLRKVFQTDAGGAEELEVLGRWLMNECHGPVATITRMSRKLFKLGGSAEAKPLMAVLGGLVGEDGPSHRQQEALDEIRIALRPR